jgi:PAS domain-containing protein
MAHGIWQGLTDHVTANGEMFRVSQTTIANRDADGVAHSITNVAREIGAETLVTAELRAAEERMRFALEAAHAGVWEHDLVAGRVIWSDTMRNVQGFPADEAGGTFDSLIALIHPGDRAAVTALVAHAIESAESFETTFRLLWPDGSLHRIEAHSGSELFKELAPLRPAMSVAYMSGFAHRAIEHHGVLKPGVTFLQKPFTASALAGKVRAHLDAATASASASSRSPRGTPPSA